MAVDVDVFSFARQTEAFSPRESVNGRGGSRFQRRTHQRIVPGGDFRPVQANGANAVANLMRKVYLCGK
jgi:hypothetical protein